MIFAVDVDYRGPVASIAGVYFARWEDARPAEVFHSVLDVTADYRPGQFYLRELPCILRLIAEHRLSPEVIVIDGFVYLGNEGRPGLGWHLYDALKTQVPVIGVAKRRFRNTPSESELYRGGSTRPLFVTSLGMDLETAKQHVCSMHGGHRVPTLLRYVDRACRDGQPSTVPPRRSR